MSTQELSVLCQGYYGDQLIYNEKDDMVLIIPMAFIANMVDCFTEDYKSGLILQNGSRYLTL